MKTTRSILVLILFGVLIIAGCGTQSTSNDPMAFVDKIEKGDALVKRAADKDFVKIEGKLSLFEGDIIRTTETSEVVLMFSTGAKTRVMPKTDYQMKKQQMAQTSQKVMYTRLIQGVIYFYVPKGTEGAKKFEIDTDHVVASIKGTVGKVTATPDSSSLTVSEGVVAFMNKADGKSIDVAAFMEAACDKNGMNGPKQVNTFQDPNLSGQITVIEDSGGR